MKKCLLVTVIALLCAGCSTSDKKQETYTFREIKCGISQFDSATKMYSEDLLRLEQEIQKSTGIEKLNKIAAYERAQKDFNRASSAQGGCTSEERFEELRKQSNFKLFSEYELECTLGVSYGSSSDSKAVNTSEASQDDEEYTGNTFSGLLFHHAKKMIKKQLNKTE